MHDRAITVPPGAGDQRRPVTLDNNARSINFIWTLLAGFLVMFMQAGFALVETGMCRAKNVAHTMSMNFLVYSLSMIGFFVCGFAFMMGGINGTPAGSAAPLIGGPGIAGTVQSASVLNHMLYLHHRRKALGDLLGYSGFFLSGHSITPGALVLFFYMMVFMDTDRHHSNRRAGRAVEVQKLHYFSLCVGPSSTALMAAGCGAAAGWRALGVNAGLGHGAVDYAGSSVVHLQGGTMAVGHVAHDRPAHWKI